MRGIKGRCKPDTEEGGGLGWVVKSMANQSHTEEGKVVRI